MNAPRRWRLRTALIGLLTIISSVSFITVGAILLLVRLPQIEAETRSQLQAESDELAGGTEALISALRTQIEMIASTLFVAPHIGLQSVLERAVSGRSAFDAIYQIGADGTVLRAAVGESIGGARRAELIGSNLSGHLLYRRVKELGTPAWSDKHLSPVAGNNTVAVAVPSGDTVIVGEVPLAGIFMLLSQSGHRRKEPIWIIDQRGNLLVDSEDPARVGVVNLSYLPLGTTTPIASQPPSDGIQRLVFEGQRYDFAMANRNSKRSSTLRRLVSACSTPRRAMSLCGSTRCWSSCSATRRKKCSEKPPSTWAFGGIPTAKDAFSRPCSGMVSAKPKDGFDAATAAKFSPPSRPALWSSADARIRSR